LLPRPALTVIEFGSFVVCQLVAGDEPQLVTYDSVAGCMFYATMDDSHLLITAGSDPQS
jgi:hypothetical protein